MQTTTHAITSHGDAMKFLTGRGLAVVRRGFRYDCFAKKGDEHVVAVAIRDVEGLHVSGDLPDKNPR